MELKNIAIGALTIFLLISLGFNVSPSDTHFCRDLEIGKYWNGNRIERKRENGWKEPD